MEYKGGLQASQERYRASGKKSEANRNLYINTKYYLKHRYGISLEEYSDMFEIQNGCCAICGKHQSEFKRALAVDHDHETGEVRKLLCGRCNKAIGLAYENVGILNAMISYIETYRRR